MTRYRVYVSECKKFPTFLAPVNIATAVAEFNDLSSLYIGRLGGRGTVIKILTC